MPYLSPVSTGISGVTLFLGAAGLGAPCHGLQLLLVVSESCWCLLCRSCPGCCWCSGYLLQWVLTFSNYDYPTSTLVNQILLFSWVPLVFGVTHIQVLVLSQLSLLSYAVPGDFGVIGVPSAAGVSGAALSVPWWLGALAAWCHSFHSVSAILVLLLVRCTSYRGFHKCWWCLWYHRYH